MATRKCPIVVVCLYLSLPCCQFLVPASAVDRPVWHNNTPEPNSLFGIPVYVARDPNHNMIRKYRAFAVYYADQVLLSQATRITAIIAKGGMPYEMI